ncbi:MAG: hypothetical protein KatS3mg109_1101 [Pirellulaceae bacterium]|nr:MAG: hypothetical protein KatS3mg109_1101 [Pirellulaceae bacterium]GIW93664.1 MAG: hypothetical protein KatS3mg110_1705 [Pirellulaceae bacterium]
MSEDREKTAAGRGEACAYCGSSRTVTRYITEQFPYGVGSQQVTLSATVPVVRCEECGGEFSGPEAEAARHEAVCRHLGLMSPRQIRALRARYGMSRREFAELTGIGQASLARWERGSLLQNAAMDRLLYLLEYAENVDRLRSRRTAAQDSCGDPPESHGSNGHGPRLRVFQPTPEDWRRARRFSPSWHRRTA